MRLASGTRLGPYEILAPLGAGGMGEVYRAADPRIGREVAIKVLPASVAGDSDRLRRFEQEVRAAGALNHPNILTIFDVGSHDGSPYIVSELLEGETLRERLGGGPLSRRKAVDYAAQIARGLAAAHQKSITHRDLKPENLFLTTDGRAKILDFGLAKLTQPEEHEDGEAEQPTVSDQTRPGTVLGTAGYMSPEQVQGRRADHRSDIFSFGVVLYEMLAGRRAFQGNSTVEVLHAILKQDPPDVPDPALARMVRHCLEKNPQERFQSAQDLAFDLEALAEPEAAPARPPARRRAWAAGLAALALLAVALFFLGRRLQRNPAPGPPMFRQLTFRQGVITGARFAPDGQTIVYSAAWDGKPMEVFATRAGAPESRPLGLPGAGVLGVSPAGDLAIALGCELNWGECRGTLARVPQGGGAPRELLEDVEFADWSPDGKNLVVVRPVEGRYRLESPIGKVLYETAGWLKFPRFSPQGDRIAFIDHPVIGETSGGVATVDLGGKRATLTSGWKNLHGLAWSATGEEVWFSGNRVSRTQAIHAVTLAGVDRVVLRSPGYLFLSDVARDGRALVRSGNPRSRIVCRAPGASGARDLSWFDWSTAVDLSADGKTLLFYEWGEAVAANPTVYLRKTDGADPVRLGDGRALALSPDGKWAAALEAGSPQQLTLLPAGAGEARRLPRSGISEYYTAAWFPDSRRLLLVAAGPDGAPRTWTQDVDGGEARPVTPEGARATLVSPDGKLLAAYGADGDFYLFPAEGGEPRPIRGLLPGDDLVQWSADGRFLFVRGLDRAAVEVFRVELASGRRERWQKLEGPDPVGLIGIQEGPAAVRMTPDGKYYLYTYWYALKDLYLVEGLR